MSNATDSTYSTQPVGDTGQGNSSAALLEQAYQFPVSGATGGDSSMYANQSFAPPNTAESLPPLSIDSETGTDQNGIVGQSAGMPLDTSAALPPGDLNGAQSGANPWDTYVMNPAAELGDTTGAQPVDASGALPSDASGALPSDASGALPEVPSPEQVIPQLEQQLQAQFEEVVQLGTSGDLNQPETQAQLHTALNSLLETAVNLGAAKEMAESGAALPTAGEAQPVDASAQAGYEAGRQAGAEAMPVDPTMQAGAEAMPVDPTMQAGAEAMPVDPTMQAGAEAMPVDPTMQAGAEAEAMPAEAMPAEAMPAEAMPAEAMPAEAMPAEAMPAEAMPAEAMPAEALPTEGMAPAEVPYAAGQTDAAPLEVNPYEPQVPPVSPESFATYDPAQVAVPGQGLPMGTQPAVGTQQTPVDLNLMHDQLQSQVEQLLTIATQVQPNTGNPADAANSGTVDNFKTALLNAVKTAHDIGAQGMAQQASAG